MTTPLLGLSEVSEGVVNQATVHNTALRQLEALLVRALSMSTASPPGSPAAGDSYIIPAGATGAWAGKDSQIAAYIGGAWSYFTATEGIRLWVNDLDVEFAFDGSAWVENGGGGGDVAAAIAAHEAAANPHPSYLTPTEGDAAYDAIGAAAAAVASHEAASDPHPQYLTQTEGDSRYLQAVPTQPFDVHAFYPGIPGASAKVLRIPVARAVAFPDDFAGSYGMASVAATASAAFEVQKNGVSIGTITFAAAATTATFATSGASVSLVAGDILSIIAPASPDATLSDPGFALAGTR